MHNRNYRDGWNSSAAQAATHAWEELRAELDAASADNGALRKEVEALRGLLAAQRAESAAARTQGEQSMRAAMLRWHDEQRVRYRELSCTSGIAGAYMGAHEESIAAIDGLNGGSHA